MHLATILAAAFLLRCAAPRQAGSKNPKAMGLNPVLSERVYLPALQSEKKSDWYSYIILGRRPVTAEDTILFTRLHSAFRKVFRLSYERKVEKPDGFYLNRIHWLVVDSIPSPESLPDLYFVEHYDYDRASLLMHGMADLKGDEMTRTGLYIVYEDDPLLGRTNMNWSTTFHIPLERLGMADFEGDFKWFRDNIQENSELKRSVAIYRNTIKAWLDR